MAWFAEPGLQATETTILVSLSLNVEVGMRSNVLVMAAFAIVAACKVVTSPGGGAPGSDVMACNNFYQSAHNGSQNPAVDTVAAGDTVVWKWSSNGSHQIRSTGVGGTIFRNSVVFSTASASYAVTFKNPGTYPYDCGVHGSAMTRVIVVQ